MATATRELAERSTTARPTGFRPASRSRVRIVGGTLLSLFAVGAILLIFSTADKRVPVLQLVHDVPAGSQLSAGDLRTVELSVDPSLQVVPAAERSAMVGQYAVVRMVAGALLQRQHLQPGALLAAGSAVVAVVVPPGAIPIGLVEQSNVQLVFPVENGTPDAAPPPPVTGRVVGLPSTVDPVTGELSVSVEVPEASAATVAAAPKVRLVLLSPGASTP